MRKRISLLTLVAIASLIAMVAYARSNTHKAGAKLLPNYDNGRLLGFGMWKFSFELPSGTAESSSVGLQIRRSKATASASTRAVSWVSDSDADKVLYSSGVGLNYSSGGAVAIQLVDLNKDLSDKNSITNVLAQGGISSGEPNLPGGQATSKLEFADDFFIGRFSSVNINHESNWVANELRLLQIYTGADKTEYVYDVLLVIRN